MVRVLGQIIDGTVLTSRYSRQKRPNGRYLRAKCGQNFNQVANGLVVWIQPLIFQCTVLRKDGNSWR